MSVTAIVTGHQDGQQLAECLRKLEKQTRKPDEILVYYSCIPDLSIPKRLYTRLIECENYGDWGHRKRQRGVLEAKSEFLFFVNADDSYDPTFIEKLYLPEYDFIYCNFDSKNARNCNAALHMGAMTSGCYLVRSQLARKAGYTSVREYHADWLFIRDILDLEPKIYKVEEELYKHC